MPNVDEFFVASFGTNVKLLHDSSQTQKHLEDSMSVLRAYGTSTLYDALSYGIKRVERSERPRKALIVFSDGNDNGSDASHGEVVREVQRSAVLLYFVAIGSPVLVDSHTLDALANISGGRTLYVGKRDQAVSPVLEQIRVELSQQYYLGYYSPRRPGFHRIRVEVPGRNLKIRAKTGYAGD
jgi:Ca-activated chloride channel family protein